MLIIWKGRGFFIALVAFAWLLAADWLTGEMFGEGYYSRNGWPKLLGFWAAAATVFLLRSFFRVPSLLTRDAYTEAEEELPGLRVSPYEGELFFVRARYWPALLALLGVVFFFVRD